MADHGDDLSRRYRELAREEPPAALDDAILAASRRAVAPRPRMRWATPVSLAAVLVLGVGVALRMQVEEPGIETSAPAPAASAEYPVPEAAEAPAAPAVQTAPLEKRQDKVVQPKSLAESPRVLADAAAPAPSAPPPPTAAARSAPAAPPPMSITIPAQSAPPPQELAASSAPAPARTKREALSMDLGQRKESAQPRDAREVELERIVRLRNEGRHEEADKALEEFRRRHADYRIAPEMWERVKPR